MKKNYVMALALLAASLTASAANTVQTVTSVATAVSLASDVDYHISSATPFGTGGSIDISTASHAVVIFDKVRPSTVRTLLGSNITIDGKKAVLNQNCQVRIYNGGAMVLPYTETKPLTVYTEENFGGESADDYSVNTVYGLSGKSMNNKISSFKLKRGYMVCFATQSNGQGYSRVFIADKEDLALKNFPKVLKGKISFIRISKWNNTDKRGWAGTWTTDVQEKLNTTWCYNWDDSNHGDWVDREYVTQRHHKEWPGVSSVGNNTTGANILGFNEPDNTADSREHPLTVSEALALWPEVMATGRRIGSPAVAGNYNWLYEFIDSIDARGWRCDFIAVHAYWYKDWAGWKSQLEGISKRCGGRPIWITEMNYGANWTGWPGSDTSGSDANYAIEKQHMGPILDYLNDSPIIERYAFYNNVQDCRYAVKDGNLTPIGEYYASLPSNLSYNGQYDVVPKNWRMNGPSDLAYSFQPNTSKITLTWKDNDGEFNDSVVVERKIGEKGKWTRLAGMTVKETPGTNTFTEYTTSAGTYYYRIHAYGYDGTQKYSNEVANAINGAEGTADMQWGQIKTGNTVNTYNYFAEPFTETPAVVFGGTTYNDTKVVPVERVSSMSKVNGMYPFFVFNYFPWNAAGEQTMTKTEQSSYLVAKPGNGTIGDLNYEAGYVHDAAGKAISVKRDTVEFKFDKAFKEAPVVFVTPYYSATNFPYMARVWDVTNEGFKVILQRQKAIDEKYPGFSGQKVAYVAIEKGRTVADNKLFVVKDTVMKFTSGGIAYPVNFDSKLVNPLFYTQFQSFDRKVAALLRVGTPTNKCNVRLVTDNTDKDNYVVSSSKPVIETVGWMTISDYDDPSGIGTVTTDKASAALDYDINGTRLEVTDATAATVYVYGANGSLETTASVIDGKASVDVTSLPAGVHIVKTNTGRAAKFMTGR